MAFQRPFLISLKRGESSLRWGFGIKGGRDYGEPLTVQNVQEDSLAETFGLRDGDEVIQVGRVNIQDLTLGQVHELLARCGNKIEMFIIREDLLIPRKGKEPPTVKAVVHNPYNSPLSLYSTENIAHELARQTKVLTEGHVTIAEEDDGPESLSFKEKSAVFKLLEEQNRPGELPPRTVPQSATKHKAPPPPPPRPKHPPSEHLHNGYDTVPEQHQDKYRSRIEYQTSQRVVNQHQQEPVQYRQTTVYQTSTHQQSPQSPTYQLQNQQQYTYQQEQSYQQHSGYHSPGIRQTQQHPGYQSPAVLHTPQHLGYQSPSVQQTQQHPGYQSPGVQHTQQHPGYQSPGVQQTQQRPGYQSPGISQHSQQQPVYQSPGIGINQQYPGYQSPTKQQQFDYQSYASFEPLNQVNYQQKRQTQQQYQQATTQKRQTVTQQHQTATQQHQQSSTGLQQHQQYQTAPQQQQHQTSSEQRQSTTQSHHQQKPQKKVEFNIGPEPPPRGTPRADQGNMAAVYKQQYEQHLQNQREQQEIYANSYEDEKPRAHIIEGEIFEHNSSSGTPITYKAPPSAPAKPHWPPPPQQNGHWRPAPDSPTGMDISSVWPPRRSTATELPRQGFNPAAVREQGTGRQCVWPPPKQDSGRTTPQSPSTGRRIIWNPSPSPPTARKTIPSPSRRKDIAWPPPSLNGYSQNKENLKRGSPRMSRRAQFDDYIHEHASVNVPQTYRPPPGTQHIEFR